MILIVLVSYHTLHPDSNFDNSLTPPPPLPCHCSAEWNASNVVKATSVPDILLRAGRIVQPLVISKGANNPAVPKKVLEEGVSEKKKMQRTITGNKKHKK